MEERTQKCVNLKFECQQLSEKVYSASSFSQEEIDDIRKKIHEKLEIVLNLLKRS